MHDGLLISGPYNYVLDLPPSHYPFPHANPLPYPTAPKIFPATYSMMKHFMNDYTRQKILVLGSKSPQCRMLVLLFDLCIQLTCFTGNWKEELQKYIAPDQLPEVYGGTRCEPDPWCTDHVSPPLVKNYILVDFNCTETSLGSLRSTPAMMSPQSTT